MSNPLLQPDPDETLDPSAGSLHDLTSELPAALDAPPLPDAGDGAAEADSVEATPLQAIQAVSGLNTAQRARARELVMQAALLGVARAPEIHYTRGPNRWEGIANGYRAWRGQFPRQADCSSFATWVLWQGLGHFHLRDLVNGQNWKAGWTCTMIAHGRRVVHRENLRVGDLVFYGTPCDKGHVAIYIGGDEVVSHGSEGGPYRLRVGYRPDIHSFRRYI